MSKNKNPKHIDRDEKKIVDSSTKKNTISDVFLDQLKGAFSTFDKISQERRIELYGDKEYLEQFWEYFKKECPNLLETVEKKDLPLYIQAIENKGFTLPQLTKKAGKLHEEFSEKESEQHVVEQSLSVFKTFCEDKSNKIPDGIFKKFADFAGFDHNKCLLGLDGILRTVDDVFVVWKKFVEHEGIKISPTVQEHIEAILTPQYNPTERIIVNIALNKIRQELPGGLKKAFDLQFPLPIDMFSPYQTLTAFKNEWMQFVSDHSNQIDEKLAKKLDAVIVTNGDIQQHLLKSGKKFDSAKSFSSWEQYFRRIFNKFITRQLFEEVQKNQDTIDYYLHAIGQTFKEFPPYVNQILHIYPFDYKTISTIDVAFDQDMQTLDHAIILAQEQYASASEEEKKILRKKIHDLQEQKEHRRWQAYIAFLVTKDPKLADVFAHLVHNKFNFATLSLEQQQLLVNILVKDKLEDTIKNKVPELLCLDEQELKQFVDDLFDLKKKDIILPTKYGNIPISFIKKEFFADIQKELPSIYDLENIQNLPLNFVAQLTSANSDFFEKNPIFDSLYYDIVDKQGTKHRLNDAYKVRINKGGKIVEGYLSAYCPLDEYNTEEHTGKELFLYSEPVTSPYQERELVTWSNEQGGSSNIPVVIKDTEQQDYSIEVLDKQLHLNGEALGALLFGYVLGQQSFIPSFSPQQEQALAKKFGKLKTYKDKEQDQNIPEDSDQSGETGSSSLEKSEKEKFFDAWKSLKGYNFSEEIYKKNAGFVEGTTLFLPFFDSPVPPLGRDKSWIRMVITHIDEQAGTFSVQIFGNEFSLGQYEGLKKTFSMCSSTFDDIKTIFESDIYKVPSSSGASFDDQMKFLTEGGLASDLEKYFGDITCTGSKFQYTLGNYAGKEVTHFGIYQPKAIDESVDSQSGTLILYKVKINSHGTVHVSADSTQGNSAKGFVARDMDFASFILFIREKGLQPKCEEQVASIHKTVKEDKEVPTKKRGYSINNVISFFKTAASKLKDGIKKYDDERAEDLTDLLTNKGKLWQNIGNFLSPFGRVSAGFQTMGLDYYLERDGRIWKKVDKWVKYFDDYDYTDLYNTIIGPMLRGEKKIVPHYKIAAILLVHIKKGKGPYAKHPVFTNEGNWIAMLLGKDHKERYLAIREKKIRELEENAHIYGGPWADQIKNELVELEMRYIVHVMDGRHMGAGDDVKYYFQNKYSKKFVDELEGAYTGFFKQSTIEEGYGKVESASFEFARVEYFRQLADRPQQALPYLKVMAMKAINETQWQVFESAVLAGMLSGVFLNKTFAATQSFIQKICRTRGFLPGIFAKDIKQQTKIQRLLDLFSAGKFSSATNYNAADFSYRVNKAPQDFFKKFSTWIESGSTRRDLSKFLDFTGKNVEGKTLLDLHADPKISSTDKALLKEFIDKSNEKDEELDKDVQQNTSSLIGSILTKSQSVVDKMIRIDQGGFAGQNGDEIQNMKAFADNMKKAIPQTTITSLETVKFFVDKFLNWFGERGFSGDEKLELLKRLKWCKEHSSSSEVQYVLHYGIVGQIVSSLASRNATLPDELAGALGAWQNFFEKNITTILHPDIISSCFGPSYQQDLAKLTPFLEPWEEVAPLLDREENYFYLQELDKDARKEANFKKRKMSNDKNCLNVKLYNLAQELERKCSGFSNKFKRDVTEQKKTVSKSSPKKATGAKIKNPEVLENLKNIMENKSINQQDPNASDDYMMPSIYDDFDMAV